MATRVSNLAKTCCDATYDILTIVISIADVVTDIIVLISFYEKGRSTFFALSLAILILAQCSYSMAFALRFSTIDEWHPCLACCAFCVCLPCGPLIAFCIFLASQEADVSCCMDVIDWFGLDRQGLFRARDTDGAMARWIRSKLDKHLGFILEAAIEAFPQSLLQIIAIVYYEEANYVSIASILLSMFSVMTKSLAFSNGVDKATFAWTWLWYVLRKNPVIKALLCLTAW